MTIKEVSEKFGISQDTLRYYERVGMIPTVTRTSSGIRNYQEQDLFWVDTAVCMRNAGLSTEVVAEYVRLYLEGEQTIMARLKLLEDHREQLLDQQKQLEEMLELLNSKIRTYEDAIRTGKLSHE